MCHPFTRAPVRPRAGWLTAVHAGAGRSHHSSLQTWTNYFKAMRDALADGGVKVGGQSSGPLARDAEAEVTLEAPKLEDQTIIFSFRLSPALPAPGSDRELCDFEDAHLKATQEFLLHLLHEMKESARGEAAAVGRVSHNTASSALSPSGTGVGASSACSGREWAHRPQAPPGNGAPTLVRSAKSEELHRSEASPPDGAPLLVRNAKSAELPCKRVTTKRGRGAKRNRTELEVVSDSSDSS